MKQAALRRVWAVPAWVAADHDDGCASTAAMALTRGVDVVLRAVRAPHSALAMPSAPLRIGKQRRSTVESQSHGFMRQ